MSLEPLTRPSALRALLARHGVQLTKRFGQHFLADRNHLLRVVEAAALTPSDTVLEIGPGAGVLTVELAARAGQVIAVELDRGLLAVLEETLAPFENVRVVAADALKVPWEEILPADTGVKVAANIPYNITSPLLVRMLEKTPPFTSLTLMVQKEVADRLRARPGTPEYGALSVFAQFHAQVELVAVVPRGAFFPPPKVDSAVVLLTPYPTPPVEVPSAEIFLAVSRAAFGQRRKTLGNALSAGLDLPRATVLEALERAGIDAGLRGEALGLDQFAAIARSLAHG